MAQEKSGKYAGSEETGTRDEHYDLISALYHTLQEAETACQYMRDAKSAGDDELAGFFEEVKKEARDRAERAKSLLSRRLGEVKRAA